MHHAGPTLADRYAGTLLGLAVGDALGAPVEARPRGSFAPITGFRAGGWFRVERGQWTDDTSLALCLAESLLECNGFDPLDQLRRYVRWYRHGHWSSKGRCFGIGRTTEAALIEFEQTGRPWCGPTTPGTATNGSVMRLAPVVLKYFPDRAAVLRHAAESSRTTHGAVQAVQGCQLLAHVLTQLLAGAGKEHCLDGAAAVVTDPRLARLAQGAFRRKPPSRIRSSGFVVHTLEAALWSFFRADSFSAAVLCAANLGDDADTVAAVAGQLAGAHYGVQAIAPHWLKRLHRRPDIQALALALLPRG